VVRSTPCPALGEAGTKGNSLWGDACHAIESRGHRGPGRGGWHVFGDFSPMSETGLRHVFPDDDPEGHFWPKNGPKMAKKPGDV
jgi:hypothetical protein